MRQFDRILLNFTVFITGAAVLIIEILGTRVISPFYGQTIFVWTSSITVTLGTLALGYYVGGRLVDRYPSFKTFFSGIFVAGSLLLVPMKIDQWVLPLTDTLGLKFGPLFAFIALFSLPLFLLGMAGPIVIRLLSHQVKESGSTAGRVFAISTLGSIVGGLLGGFFLLPYFSLTQIFNMAGVLLVALAGYGLLRAGVPKGEIISVAFLIISLGLYLPKYVYKDHYPSQILYHAQGHYNDLKVVSMGSYRCVTTDGATQSCAFNDGRVPPLFQELAEIFNNTQAQSLLVLGGGGGNLSAGGIDPNITVDVVDIDPEIVRLGEAYLGFASGPNHNVYIDDARSFLRKSEKTYDAVFIDIAAGIDQPYYMFSREAFQLLRRRVADDGLIIINVIGGIGEKDASAASIIKTARSVFPTVIPTTNSPDTNVTYYVHISPDPDYEFNYSPSFGVQFVEARLDESLGVLLTDNFNQLDYLFREKYASLLYLNRVFGGLKGVFSI